METPQEVEVWVILPALRKELALSLKEKGMMQKDIAKTLNMTEGAISQYLNKKRGDDLKFEKDILEKINTSANDITDGRSTMRVELQKLLKGTKENKFICDVCHVHTASEKGCNICFV